jgi:hypothetical protein
LGQAWWVTPNEKRQAMFYGESESPLMDEYYMPANLMPLEVSIPALENPAPLNQE